MKFNYKFNTKVRQGSIGTVDKWGEEVNDLFIGNTLVVEEKEINFISFSDEGLTLDAAAPLIEEWAKKRGYEPVGPEYLAAAQYKLSWLTPSTRRRFGISAMSLQRGGIELFHEFGNDKMYKWDGEKKLHRRHYFAFLKKE